MVRLYVVDSSREELTMASCCVIAVLWGCSCRALRLRCLLEDYELLEREALALLEDRVLLPLDDADAYAAPLSELVSDCTQHLVC